MPRKSSRLATRLAVVPRGALKRLLSGPRSAPADPARILVAHQLLLGDTLMLTALLARLRRRYPRAEIVMTVSRALLPLYASRPYGVRAVPFDSRDRPGAKKLLVEGPFDLALVPGDNRHAMLALAMGARWVVAFEGDRPGWKNRLADQLIAFPDQPASLADMFARLGSDEDDLVYDRSEWPAPAHEVFELPEARYAVLHVGAGSPLRLWQPEKWRSLANRLAEAGLAVVLCAGPGEESIVADIDPARCYRAYAGVLDLAQLWRLLEGADLLVCLDSGASHLAKLTGTPTVALYGPGSAILFGTGRFWRGSRFRAVTIDDFPCRDQRTVFKREIHWVRRCQRTLKECPAPACMHAIGVDMVWQSCDELLRT